MAIEIERKFLVTSDAYKALSHHKYTIKQGFLNTHKERTVRIRVTKDKGFITVKGKSNDRGTIRFEWEKEISVTDAEDLLLLCEDFTIEKTRYLIKHKTHLFEVDEFEGINKGLIIAEIELKSEDTVFEKPTWLGQEVTGEVKYYNSQLSKNPYTKWKK